ncbi:MAG: RNA methyltransferase [Ruminococcus sp.]|nr:RNA methyltransferase [Ruminococcus sp.]
MYNYINSLSNDKIKYAYKLVTSTKFRKENNEFLLEGLRLCVDASKTLQKIKWTYFTENAYKKNSEEIDFLTEKSESSFQISQAVCEKLTSTENSQGIFCVCKMNKPLSENDISKNGKYIALENVQDPANLGAICRTAEALGISGAIVENGCDIYNPKAQRASMGSLLRLPIIKTTDLSQLLDSMKQSGMTVYATTPSSAAEKIIRVNMSGGVIAVIGNEANGVTDKILPICEQITIPMLGRAESLNASMAAAITMWEMMRNEVD